MNCVVTDLIPDFSVYPMNYDDVNYEGFASKLGFATDKNPGINWYKSALFRFEVLGMASLPRYTWRKMRIETIDPNEDLTHPALASNLSSKS
jgi:predicted methyltransferase